MPKPTTTDDRLPNALKELSERRPALLEQAEQSIKASGLPASPSIQSRMGICLAGTFRLNGPDLCPAMALQLLADRDALGNRACLDLRIAHRLQDSLGWISALWRRLQMHQFMSPSLALACGPHLMHDLERRGIRSVLPLDHFISVPGAAEDTLFLLDADLLRTGPVDVRQVYEDGSADYYLCWIFMRGKQHKVLPLGIARGWTTDFAVRPGPG